MTRGRLRIAARRILRAGLAAVEPGSLVRAHLRLRGEVVHAGGRAYRPERLFIVAVGKASVAMVRAAHRALGRRVTEAIVIAPTTSPRLPRTRSFVAGHPIPTAAGVRAGKCVIELLKKAERGDLVLLLLSGGASALMPAPVACVSLRDKQRVTRLLLHRGANIAEINAVRKKLSRLKGGGFARLAAPAEVLALALSDVPGDDIGTIGSGPAVEDPSAGRRARRSISKFLTKERIPAGVRHALSVPDRRAISRVPARTLVIGSGRTFAQAAARKAQDLGFLPHVLPDSLQGEARACGPSLVTRFAFLRKDVSLCLIATGETVVRVRGRGRGGRNQELALSAIPALGRLDRPAVLAAFATDGVDGRSAESGGLVDDRTLDLALELGLSIKGALDRNDSNAALRRLGALIRTGQTATNVADITLVLG